MVFNGYTHEQFVDLFHAIGSDPDNRVVILTGSGDAFMESITPDGFDFFNPRGYDKIYREGKKVLMNILDIEAPMIAAVNGPVRLHSEYILLADIVLATPSIVFQDKPHFELGIVPGDGVHLSGRRRLAQSEVATSFSPGRNSTPKPPRNGARSTKSCRLTSYCLAPARSRRGWRACRH